MKIDWELNVLLFHWWGSEPLKWNQIDWKEIWWNKMSAVSPAAQPSTISLPFINKPKKFGFCWMKRVVELASSPLYWYNKEKKTFLFFLFNKSIFFSLRELLFFLHPSNQQSESWFDWIEEEKLSYLIGWLWLGTSPLPQLNSIPFLSKKFHFISFAFISLIEEKRRSESWLKLGEMRVGWLSWLGSKPITVYSVIWRVKLFNEGGNQQFINNSISLNQQK